MLDYLDAAIVNAFKQILESRITKATANAAG